MSNFGNETVTASMNMAGKGIEAIMSLLKYLLAHQERKATKLNNKLKQAQIKDMKNNEYRNDCIEYLNTKKGIVDLKSMIGSKQKITTIAQTMSRNNFTRFSRLAKMYGITFSAVEDRTNKDRIKELKKELKELNKKSELSEQEQAKVGNINKEIEQLKNQKKQYVIFVFDKDLEAVMDITNRMNRELRLDSINKEVDELENKGELLADEKERLEELKKEKEAILNEEFDSINGKYNDNVINDKYEGMDFEEAVEKLTDRGGDKEPAVICERINPSNHMIIYSEERTYEDRVHTDTIFDVYRNDEKQTCDLYKDKHGQFSFKHDIGGRPTSEKGMENWLKLKEEMKEKGGFTNNVVVFKSVAEYQEYRKRFEKVQSEMKPKENVINVETNMDSYKDYAGIVNQLQGQLAEHNLMLNNKKEVCKIGSDKPIVESELSSDEKLYYKNGVLLSKQISAYENMNDLQTKMAFINEQKEMNEELYQSAGDKEAIKDNYERSKAEYDNSISEIKAEIDTLSKEADELEMKRESIASVDIVEDMKQERIVKEDTLGEEKEQENTLREEMNTQSKEQWEKDMADRKANINTISNQRESVKTQDSRDVGRE